MDVTVRNPTSTWSMADARRVFSELSAPDPAQLLGRWEGRFVGGPGLLRLSHTLVATSPLRGWCGKEFIDEQHVQNLVRRAGAVRSSLGATLSVGPSRIDERPAILVSYAATAPPPVKWTQGELRWLSPDEELLGVLLFPLGSRSLGPFPFCLRRA